MGGAYVTGGAQDFFAIAVLLLASHAFFHDPLKNAGKLLYSHPPPCPVISLFLPQTLASAQQEVRDRNDQITKLQARVTELEGGQPAPAPAAAAAATAASGTEGNTTATTTATATATAGGGGAAARATRSLSPAPASQQQQQQQRGASPTRAGRSAMAVVAEAGAGGDDGGEASLRNRLMARSEYCTWNRVFCLSYQEQADRAQRV